MLKRKNECDQDLFSVTFSGWQLNVLLSSCRLKLIITDFRSGKSTPRCQSKIG